MLAETICSAVSVAGLGIAAVTAYRKRFLSAARIAAYSLVPIGLVMTGVVKWLAHTAFSPTAWAGFVVLGAAWLLFLATRSVERRKYGTRKERRAAARAARENEATAPAASGPALPGRAPARPASGDAGRSTGSSRGAKPDEDFSDIEAILKKHGI
ncbi:MULTISPECIES: hypothetical protein [unclassified Streptomyces]|uniref:Uncharacterized protein n=3 Tax=Streptomyces TaxID=1883 RepID=A0ABU2R3A3_9ACTN|nr:MULTISPECIES: hypothetical protein [unclassified Streptomyces]ASY35875.1 hypothetical protein CAC01_26950 [Streptomyces sp. CLI2509]EGJ78604.1 hypothetical protein STTU_5814 [Streptomyces sp. Tu6071]MDT0410793.1 hypothetical protein [Streptomyces sp. DSM 41979]MYQ61323.1 hypothetical protein [Streptomyces sp. SID4926]MYR29487.1 hypothetical protein [Streptomyces sp. SID4945]